MIDATEYRRGRGGRGRPLPAPDPLVEAAEEAMLSLKRRRALENLSTLIVLKQVSVRLT
jgi:hypothetical protein